MKAVILCGGRGSRFREETDSRPKSLVEIGGRPILWHIMKIYSHHGVRDFVIALGYQGHLVKEYFSNYVLRGSDVTIDLASNRIDYHPQRTEPWRVTLVDTGEHTATGGRLRRIRRYLEEEAAFCLTYGDGVADIDVLSQLGFHRAHGLAATMTVVRPPARFGASLVQGDRVVVFEEKAPNSEGFINAGFFVLSPTVIDLVEADSTAFEREPLERLARLGQLAAWRHTGFWQALDTVHDRDLLEEAWSRGGAPWRVWASETGCACGS